MLLLKISSINLFGNLDLNIVRHDDIPIMNIYKSNRDSTPVFVGKKNVKTLKNTKWLETPKNIKNKSIIYHPTEKLELD